MSTDRFLNQCPSSPNKVHEWTTYPDVRVCRRCLKRESRGDRCFNGHDWSMTAGSRTCRRCGLHVSDHEVDAWEWRNR